MLLEKFQTLVRRGAESPLTLWQDDYRALAHELSGYVLVLEKNAPYETEAGRKLQTLRELLNQRSPDDYALAGALLFFAELLRKIPDVRENAICDYTTYAQQFYHRAEVAHFHEDLRAQSKRKLSPEKQRAADRHLFEHEGMMYCLEYYLVMYKAMCDAPTEQERLNYVERETLDLGTGELPGLRTDFATDEALTKFVYRILDDTIRERLVNETYTFKAALEQSTLHEIMNAFQRFLLAYIQAFQDAGIERLSSFFFSPYGEKTPLGEVYSSIQHSNP